MLVRLPIVLLAVKELLAMTLVFYYLVSFKAVLIPVIVLLAVAFPFFRGIDSHSHLPFFISLYGSYTYSIRSKSVPYTQIEATSVEPLPFRFSA